MNLYQCQKHAERNGFDSDKFIAHFPKDRVKWGVHKVKPKTQWVITEGARA